MATVKIVLRKKQNKDGTYPLAIRITKDRTSSFIHLGQHVLEKDWDSSKHCVRKSHPNATRLNNFILAKLAEAHAKSLELETQNTAPSSSKAVKQKLKPNGGSTFFAQGAVFLNNLRVSGKYNRVTSEEPRLKQFREFLGGNDITFQEIDVPLLKRFKAYLKGKRKVSERTIMNYLILIRTVFNQAIAANIVDQNHYPFGRGKITIKFPETLKIGLSPDEVKAIEVLDLDNPVLNHARNVWLFSFYFAGIRAGDVLSLKWSDFQDDRLYYAMNKNDKADSLKLSAKTLAILEQYKELENEHNLVFPDLNTVTDFTNLYEVQRKTSYAIKRLNKSLKEIASLADITKPLTMHISRHTFGNISGDKIPIQMLQKLYRHSSITTTIGYQANFMHKDADDALAAVIDL
jgi:integrase